MAGKNIQNNGGSIHRFSSGGRFDVGNLPGIEFIIGDNQIDVVILNHLDQFLQLALADIKGGVDLASGLTNLFQYRSPGSLYQLPQFFHGVNQLDTLISGQIQTNQQGPFLFIFGIKLIIGIVFNKPVRQ